MPALLTSLSSSRQICGQNNLWRKQGMKIERNTLTSRRQPEQGKRNRTNRWEDYKTRSTRRTPATEEINGRPILNFRSKLTRWETTIATLVRSECIGFRAFLHRMKVPGFNNPNCHCGEDSQTAKHMVLYCPLVRHEQLFEEAGSQDYKELTSVVRGLRAVARWTIRSGLLAQFKLYEHTDYLGFSFLSLPFSSLPFPFLSSLFLTFFSLLITQTPYPQGVRWRGTHPAVVRYRLVHVESLDF
jgi:hypothetical protein